METHSVQFLGVNIVDYPFYTGLLQEGRFWDNELDGFGEGGGRDSYFIVVDRGVG